ncbi:hypothetical protein [Nocardia nepalensis]|uniref:hypothetical protein n=1 Tax=Nocardia nepalensis TaxID=3375448 RepID=UPI003B67B15B
MSILRFTVVVLLAGVVAGCSGHADRASESATNDRVVDGDTLCGMVSQGDMEAAMGLKIKAVEARTYDKVAPLAACSYSAAFDLTSSELPEHINTRWNKLYNTDVAREFDRDFREEDGRAVDYRRVENLGEAAAFGHVPFLSHDVKLVVVGMVRGLRSVIEIQAPERMTTEQLAPLARKMLDSHA